MKFNAKNFRKMIQALEEGKPENYNQAYYFDVDCKTPACVLGHLASRRDLQRVVKIGSDGEIVSTSQHSVCSWETMIEWLGVAEVELLFGSDGCGNARRDRTKALAYLEDFYQKKLQGVKVTA